MMRPLRTPRPLRPERDTLKRLVDRIRTVPPSDIANVAAPVFGDRRRGVRERIAASTDRPQSGSTPGAFTREVVEQPGIVVNVRGMQGMGRVNTMIDGVPQNFRNLSGHSGTFDNMAYVDSNMLAGVDITRGAVSGAEGVGTLSGAAEFPHARNPGCVARRARLWWPDDAGDRHQWL